MKAKLDITAIIITYNEEKNINNCIKSIKGFVKDIFVLDSNSSDKTIKILKKKKIRYKTQKFKNYSTQFNSAIKLSQAKTKWLMRIDADETVDKKFFLDLRKFLVHISNDINGIYVTRRYFFLNKEIKYGGTFPHKTLRIWKKGFGKCDNVFMDEKIITKGKVREIDIDIVDKNKNDFKSWKNKHKKYALFEALNYFKNKKNKNKDNHYKKFKIYYSFPIFLRVFLLFIYKYIIQLGFMDGFIGLKFNYWHILWFRMIVDKNIFLSKKKLTNEL